MSGIRLILFFIIALFGIFLSSSGWNLFMPASVPMPNLTFLTLLYVSLIGSHAFGQKSQPAIPKMDSAAIVGFAMILGYLSDLVFGTPVGFQALLFAVLSFLIHILSGKLVGGGIIFSFIFGGIMTVIYQFTFLGMSFLFLPSVVVNKKMIFTTSLVTALITPFFFAGLRRIDKWLVKRSSKAVLG